MYSCFIDKELHFLQAPVDVSQWRDNWEYLQVTGDYQRVVMVTLEGVQELAGMFFF